jgi:hypothetical protein
MVKSLIVGDSLSLGYLLLSSSNVLQRFNAIHKGLVMSNIQQHRRGLSVVSYDDRALGLPDLADAGCHSGSELGERLHVLGKQ